MERALDPNLCRNTALCVCVFTYPASHIGLPTLLMFEMQLMVTLRVFPDLRIFQNANPHASWSGVPASHFEACVAGCALVWPLGQSRTDLVSSEKEMALLQMKRHSGTLT